MLQNKIKRIIKIVLVALFLGCLGKWQYSYYELVRFIGMIGFGVLAWIDKDNKLLLVVWVASAILINPLVKIALGRTLWNVVDVIWAIVLVGTIFIERKE